ncbi:hypothetical protein HCN44_007655 [Aphidius gifuensis]|uniref:Uncharacterized protein n=1 Tax=Aphidius gifuensis TaxID=684658 RepID=A0A834XLF4_APHGI|nr:hypothetical protein HCN44_007655 [Aphidius gifuensis]
MKTHLNETEWRLKLISISEDEFKLLDKVLHNYDELIHCNESTVNIQNEYYTEESFEEMYDNERRKLQIQFDRRIAWMYPLFGGRPQFKKN